MLTTPDSKSADSPVEGQQLHSLRQDPLQVYWENWDPKYWALELTFYW